jgi:hypothetical protein
MGCKTARYPIALGIRSWLEPVQSLQNMGPYRRDMCPRVFEQFRIDPSVPIRRQRVKIQAPSLADFFHAAAEAAGPKRLAIRPHRDK